MNADQVSNAIRTLVNAAIGWLKLASALALALLLTATLLQMFGHQIPYIPSFKGSLQEVGIFTVAIAYWLK